MPDQSRESTDHYLRPMFVPRSIALVGATDRDSALGNLVRKNLLEAGYGGRVHLVNPNRERVGDRRCVPTLTAIGEPVDLAIVATPPGPLMRILEDAGQAKIPAAAVLTAGYAERGRQGAEEQRRVIEVARANRVRLLGPNSLGFMRTGIGLNATFACRFARRGRLALVSQSAAICAAILDFAAGTEIGFSTVVSLGAAADLDFGEILDFLITDAETESVLLYVEGVRDARRFMSALRAAARTKPVIVLKAGRHLAVARTATSHTGALVGDDRVFSAALQRAGTVRVRTYTQLFAAARMLAAGRVPPGNRLAIVSNGSGPGIMAADCAFDGGVPLASLGAKTVSTLRDLLPVLGSPTNPVNIVGNADPERFTKAARVVLDDPDVDALLAIYVPQVATPPEAAASAVIAGAKGSAKPVLAAWLGAVAPNPAHALLARAGVPHFYTPENAVEAFSFLAAYRRSQNLLLEVPALLPDLSEPDYALANALRAKLVEEGRSQMTEDETKALLHGFGVPVPETVLTASVDEALAAAKRIRYPVALKVISEDLAHKSDFGGVRLGIRNGRMLAAAYRDTTAEVSRRRPDVRIKGVAVQKMVVMPRAREVLVGVATDPIFGPVIAFGSGGVAVEAIADTALMLPPLNRRLALTLIGETRVFRLLSAFRDYPEANLDALVKILLQVSTIACTLPWVRELDLNPVLVNEERAVVVDARAVIDPTAPERVERYRHMAIHPYPADLEISIATRDGQRLRVRPIRPEDAEMERAFVAGLSERSRYMRFQHHLPGLTPQMLARFTQIDYDREMAFVAIAGTGSEQRIVAVARYVPNPNLIGAEFAIVVADEWQGRGVGGLLMSRLFSAARDVGYRYLEGSVLTVNAGMLRLMTHLGFRIEHDPEDPSAVRVVKDLT